MAAMSAQVHQLTQWVGTLQQILAARQHQQQQQQQQCSSQETKSESRSFEAMGTYNWSHDSRAVLGARQGRATTGPRNRGSGRGTRSSQRWKRQRCLACVHVGAHWRETAIHRQRMLGQWPRSTAKKEEQIRSRNEDESNRCDAESPETSEGNRHQGFAPSAGQMGRRNEEARGKQQEQPC